jgi:uncharacterized membrane protein
MKQLASVAFALLIGLFVVSQSSCYYDNEQELYPNSGGCDTASIKYSTQVKSIIQDNCVSCHSSSGTQPAYPMDNFDQIKAYALNGKLVLRTNDTLAPMPQAGLMSDCNRLKIIAWVNAGAPNN